MLTSIEPVELTFEAETSHRYQLAASIEPDEDGTYGRESLWTGSVVDVTDPDDPRVIATAEGRGLIRSFFRWGLR